MLDTSGHIDVEMWGSGRGGPKKKPFLSALHGRNTAHWNPLLRCVSQCMRSGQGLRLAETKGRRRCAVLGSSRTTAPSVVDTR